MPRLLFWGITLWGVLLNGNLVFIKSTALLPWRICLKNNHILLFQTQRLKTYVDVVFFPEQLGNTVGILHTAPIWPSFSHWRLICWESSFARFCDGCLTCNSVHRWGCWLYTDYAVYKQLCVYFNQYISSQTWESDSASVCQNLGLRPCTNFTTFLGPGFLFAKLELASHLVTQIFLEGYGVKRRKGGKKTPYLFLLLFR